MVKVTTNVLFTIFENPAISDTIGGLALVATLLNIIITTMAESETSSSGKVEM